MKYRHRGYKDTEWKDKPGKSDRKREPLPPKTPEERQLRHMMERTATLVLRCHECNHTAATDETVPTLAKCDHCAASLHVCRNCAHFDTGQRWQCSAPIESAVPEKTTANECALFSANTVLDATGRRAEVAETPRGARAAFDDLFKKS